MEAMRRERMTQWVHRGRYAVAAPVEVVDPTDDPSEPCLEPAAIRYLDEIARRCDAGDLDYLMSVGRVFVETAKNAG